MNTISKMILPVEEMINADAEEVFSIEFMKMQVAKNAKKRNERKEKHSVPGVALAFFATYK